MKRSGKLQKSNIRGGFTLVETLLVVGILFVLLSLLVPNIVTVRQRTRQKGLDAKAEILYAAAQNQLVKLRADGKKASDLEGKSLDENDWVPCDAAIKRSESGEPLPMELFYITRAHLDGGDALAKIAAAILPDGAVDAELRGAHWVIEYSAATCSVYAVFYSEEVAVETGYYTHWNDYDALRVFKTRAEEGSGGVGAASVGYCGGDLSASASSTTVTLSPDITFPKEEKERLRATLQCYNVPASKISGNVTFDVILEDAEGHSCEMEFVEGRSYAALGESGKLERHGTRCYCYLTLDDLSSADTRFRSLYGGRLTPGADLSVKLRVSCTSKLVQPSQWCEKKTNSLFDYTGSDSGNTAYISCARHLQNLDGSSGVTERITRAEQTAKITFADTADAYDWHTLYGAAPFRPIANERLREYDGGNWSIDGLHIDETDGPAGLFAAPDGLTVENLTLNEASVSVGGGAAGALAGAASDCVFRDIKLVNARVEGAVVGALAGTLERTAASSAEWDAEKCRVYLLNSQKGDWTKDDTRLSGTTAGGLIGAVTGGARIEKCFAATVLDGSACAGGLVGRAAGATLTLSECFADNYIAGKQLGGLLGGGAASLTDCYAAGYLTAPADGGSAAGLVNGTASAARCYTICVPDPAQTDCAAVSETMCYIADPDKGGITAEMTDADLLAKLGGTAFTTENDKTRSYGLDGVERGSFPYPRLKEFWHHGDWEARFQSGTPVYFECYSDGSIGISGDGMTNTLNDSRIVTGDGYGVAYRKEEAPETLHAPPPSVSLDGGAAQPCTDGFYTVEIAEKGAGGATVEQTYHVYPLPLAMRVAAPSGTGAYHTIEVNGSNVRYAFQPWLPETPFQTSGESAGLKERLSIRTPRQLRGLSLYYENYSRSPGFTETDQDGAYTHTFYQVRDLDFAGAYDWRAFAGCAPEEARTQGPIGAQGFAANYCGNCHTISRVSFASDDAVCVGLFGKTLGEVRDVVLAVDYVSTKDCDIRRAASVRTGETVYMGVLAGCNEGTIENCAVAGYCPTGTAGDGERLYVGGLVGGNRGTIERCAADCPVISISANYAKAVHAGALAGFNEGSGRIDDCYAVGHIETTHARDSDVHVAGFAGLNEGRILNSYCAVSLTNSGSAVSHGFAPTGGDVRGCLYLDKGTYQYAGELRAYSAGSDSTSGTGVGISTLRATRDDGPVNNSRSRYHGYTNGGQPAAYPYRAVVRNNKNFLVHYGDWQEGSELGEMGVFYWERETGGSNDGYHFAYVGTEGAKTFKGNTLCTAHNDGGAIRSFGYGYYALEDLGSLVSLESEGIVVSTDAGRAGRVDAEAKAALETQVKGYVFFPYTTRTEAEANGKDYVCLDAGENTDGRWTLRCNATSETYRVAPFFANAMNLEGHDEDANLVGTATDGSTTDYRGKAGSAANPYEIRSAAQLQYINWNCDAKDTKQLVGKSKEQYQSFPYLQYATLTGSGYQQQQPVLDKRPTLYWRQTHDVDCAGVADFTPIAGMSTSSSFNSWENHLYAWFGGNYDGQSYPIRNLSVTSDSFTVGVFGVTLGANIRNVILYGDSAANDGKAPRIVRHTDVTTNKQNDPTVGSYSLGGLIGLALDYNQTVNGERVTDNVICNCAIAGYEIIDESNNRQGLGDANVGGLIGVANVKLERCSAVTDIQINCTHRNGSASYGSYVRAGGLTGAAMFTVTDCYTGGSIRVGEDTKWELFRDRDGRLPKDLEDSNEARKNFKGALSRNGNTFIYVGGISGSAFSSSFYNINGSQTSGGDGRPVFSNCYTYTELPDMEGTIRGVSLIASPADRYSSHNSKYTIITIRNCYYFKPAADIRWNAPQFYFTERNGTGTLESVLVGCRGNGKAFKEFFELADTYKDTETLEKYFSAILGEEHFTFDALSEMNAEEQETVKDALRKGLLQRILLGDLDINRWLIYNDEADTVSHYETMGRHLILENNGVFDGIAGVDFGELNADDMKDRLNGYGSKSWGRVTLVETDGKSETAVNGKYSFPGNNGPLLGKDYPFPTVIRQNSASRGAEETFAYVHYGEWPKDDCYWARGRDSMEIFSGMEAVTAETPESGPYSVKTFRLYDKKNVLDGVSLTKDDFSFTTGASGAAASDVAEIDEAAIARAWEGEGEPGIARKWDAEEACYCYDVPIRARKSGSTVVTMQSTAVEGAVASFVLEAHFKLNLSFSLDAESAPAELSLYRNRPRTLTLGAKTDEKSPKDYSVSRWGTWTLAPAVSGDGELYDLTQSADNKWSIAALEPGERALKAEYVYDYHGAEYRGTMFLAEHTLGLLGIGNGMEYSEFWRCPPEVAQKEKVQPGEHKTDPVKQQGAEFFLYETASDKALGALNVKSITVQETGGGKYTYAPDGSGGFTAQDAPYEVALESDTETNGALAYRAGTLIYRGDGTPRAVTLTVRAGFANGEDYTLSTEVAEVPTFCVEFDANGGESSMRPAGVRADGTVTLPKCRFTRTGYHFDGWVLPNGDVARAGETLTLEKPAEGSSVTLRAGWARNEYYVVFFANADDVTGEMAMQKMTYDLSAPLADNAFLRPGYGFVGWNTEPDGSGVFYADGVSVDNLTAEEDGDAALYAQWSPQHELILVWGGTQRQFTVMTGETALKGYQDQASDWRRNGWTLDGWYTATDGTGLKVLDANGAVVGDVAEYTDGGVFALTGNGTLYACWTARAFVPVERLGHEGVKDNGEAAQYNGTYLIVSEPGTGTRVVLQDTDTSNTDKAQLTTKTVTVNGGSIATRTDETPTDSAYILDSELDAAKWTVTYQKYRKGYLAFSFQNAETKRGLARDVPTSGAGSNKKAGLAQAWKSLGPTDSNAQWSYNMRSLIQNDHEYCLESYEYVITGGGDSVGWTGADFRRQRSGIDPQPVYLYRLSDIYTFT